MDPRRRSRVGAGEVTDPQRPSRLVASPDGTEIAVFSTGKGPPLVLVHGASADHTTFRVVGPLFARRFAVHAIDRRGRGASGDIEPYAVDREFEDVAAVAETVARDAGTPAAVVGHSFGGRVALGAALRTESIRAVVCYEGAPPAAEERYQPEGAEKRLRDRLAAGDADEALATFLREIVGMSDEDLARYRADPVWPRRAAAAYTIVRELDAEASPAASLDALGGVRQPVLQILGGASRPAFRLATVALHARLADGRVAVIDGAKHAAHHTHPDEFVETVEAFLERH
jgi:pimeloyl-ACP methyl ester carboxylesterase